MLATTQCLHKSSGRDSVADLDAKAAFTAKQFLLAALIADQRLDDAGLDTFLAQARKRPTNGWPDRSAIPAALPQPTAD